MAALSAVAANGERLKNSRVAKILDLRNRKGCPHLVAKTLKGNELAIEPQ